MAASNKSKIVKQSQRPREKYIAQDFDPSQYYHENPAWSFANIDQEMWAFTENHIGDLFWSRILPRLRDFESQRWSEILITNKKLNHAIDVQDLNKNAQDRLVHRFIEADSLISLRITGKHRIYGYMTGRVFNILWYDDDHGDNDSCVCRSHKKHT